MQEKERELQKEREYQQEAKKLSDERKRQTIRVSFKEQFFRFHLEFEESSEDSRSSST